MLLLLVLNVCITYTWAKQLQSNESENEDSIVIGGNQYLINEPNCKIPRTDIFNDEIRNIMEPYLDTLKEPHCHYKNGVFQPPLVGSNKTSIFILADAIQYYTSPPIPYLNCSYAPFWKNGPDNEKENVEFGGSIIFVDSANVVPTTEFIRVICLSNDVPVYEDYFTFVPKKPILTIPSAQRKFNVFVVGIDSLSRGNFHRQMPQTLSTLEQLNFVEYLGYNKVAENTFPNLVPFLTGKSVSELRNICWPSNTSHFDECPFIWREYKQNGYLTAFVEDHTKLGIFRSKILKRGAGFSNSPTDYYYYSFDDTVADRISHNFFGIAWFYCFGGKPAIDKFLDYCSNLITTLKDSPLFGFFFASSISHDSLNVIRLSDSKIQQLFGLLQTTGQIQNSVVVLMADHGPRYGPILNTTPGYYELRMPLFTASLPDWFRQQYPLAYANFVDNANRLTSHFDAYEMLADLLNLNNLADDAIQRRTKQLDEMVNKPRGISLFLPIPKSRTCHQAGIPLLFCACDENIGPVTDQSLSQQVANFVVSEMNRVVTSFAKCARLSLANIVEAVYVKVEQKEDINEHDLIRITLITIPGRGIFQALVEAMTGANSEKKMRLYGSIIRLNAYGNQSICADGEAKLFCYCI